MKTVSAKNIRLRSWLVAAVLLIGLAACLGLSACQYDEVEKDPISLQTPSGIVADAGVLRWNAVENAHAYIVRFGIGTPQAKTYENATSPLVLPQDLPQGAYLIEIQAVGIDSEDTIIDSEYGRINYFVYTLSRPIPKEEDGIITVDEEGEFYYNFAGETGIPLGSGFDISLVQSFPAYLEIYAKGNGINTFDSDPFTITFNRRSEVSAITSFTAAQLAFSGAANTSGYRVELARNDQPFTSKDTEQTSLNLSEIISAGGTYVASVFNKGFGYKMDLNNYGVPTGSAQYMMDSLPKIASLQLSSSANPTLNVTHNSITFAAGANTESLHLEIYSGDDKLYDEALSNTATSFPLVLADNVGEYRIMLTAIGNRSSHYDSDTVVEEFSVTALDSPDAEISAGNTITWFEVANAQGYEVKYSQNLAAANTLTVNGLSATLDGGKQFETLTSGTYMFYVTALGRGAYQSGCYEINSESVVLYLVGELSAPSVALGEGLTLVWDEVLFANGYTVNGTPVEDRLFDFSQMTSSVGITITAIGSGNQILLHESDTDTDKVYSRTTDASTTINLQTQAGAHSVSPVGGTLEISGLGASAQRPVEINLTPTTSFKYSGTTYANEVFYKDSMDYQNDWLVPAIYTLTVRALARAELNGNSLTYFMEQATATEFKDIFVNGNGTSDNPIILRDKADYNAAKTQTNYLSLHYYQGAEIDMTGDGGNNFGATLSGSYDGGGFAILGLTVKFLNQIAENAIVRNLTLESTISQSSTDNIGMFASTLNGQLRNCTSKGSITARNRIGGLVGTVGVSGTIFTSTNLAAVSGSSFVGGIAGTGDFETNDKKSKVFESVNRGSVIGGGGAIGGIMGITRGDIMYCANYGRVTKTGGGESPDIIMRSPGWTNCKTKAVGGIAGFLAPNVVNTSEGGYIGYCYNMGEVIGTGATGGLYGETFGRYVHFSYNAGAISGTGTIGSLAGNLFMHEGQMGFTIDCVSFVSTAFIGYAQEGTSTSGNAVFALADAADAAKQLGINFVEDLEGSSAINGGYPILSWQKQLAQL